IDTDRKRGSGWNKALPGRDLLFSDGMGWEKVVLVTPLSQFYAYNIIKDKTDEIGFQDMVPDIILPDYVQVQRDRIIVRISKELLGAKPGPDWGFQCLAMGFSRVVSPNRLLNMDVKAFATPKDFGGGWDTYGDPPVIDMIVPGDSEDADRRQYELLKAYRSEPYRGEIEYAMIPFVYGREKPATATGTTGKGPAILAEPPAVRPPTPQTQPPALILPDDVSAPVKKPVVAPPKPAKNGPADGSTSTDGFLPIRKAAPATGTAKTGTTAPTGGSFQPLKKTSDMPTGFMPIRKAPPATGD
ncbi:MAG TPA: glucodextranase DOMON-like domain-containing protein, partial [Candidatus Ozemobacteraceae bacterium]|nr:glucodextranase DOMON-like domain-containing protein [Candidatus Ozemobacteraceae bacterium]